MSESPAKVRLVRCPKCENLLPEVTDYSVYQCGGCGAVLRARSKHVDSGTVSEKSDEESGERVPNGNPNESRNLDFPKRKVNNLSLGSENDLKDRNKSTETNKSTQESEDSRLKTGSNKIHPRKSVWRHRESGFRDTHEGPSNYGFAPYHEYAELVNDGVADDRAELLRKLDELKDQIVRSRPLGKEKVRPSLTFSSQGQTFNDPFRGPIQAPVTPFDRNPYQHYFPTGFHHPSCACLTCYNHHRQPRPPPPPPPPPPVLATGPRYYPHDYTNHRFTGFHNQKPHTRWSSQLRRPPRGVIVAGGQRCRPLAGGSPFIACRGCFELLQVPVRITKNVRIQMRCASCSEVMLLSVADGKLVVSAAAATAGANRRKNRKWGGSVEFSSEDYENSGKYEFCQSDGLRSGGQSLTSHKSAAAAGSLRSTSSFTSDDDEGKPRDVDSGDVSVRDDKPPSPPPPSGSPLQDHFEYSMKYNRAATGNESGRSDMEKAAAACRQRSMKDAAVATEMEISPPNEYCVNTGESGETSRDADRLKNGRTGESFFAGIIKKSFRELSRSGQHVDHGKVKVNVTVNGHPIPDRLVKKAEKLAGPIQPGAYWYDSRAGFWGMMGGPCRGIIPPFIEEFNFPMPENCADGNTNVFVNGRELHQKDLDLLASRGLPTDKDRSYIIEISGRVLDEDSGNELECLGKLAPTVESKKHGFGMKPPRTAV